MSQQAPSLAVILVSEDLEKLHAGSLVGSVASMSGMQVNVFVTMNALKPFLKSSFEKEDFMAGTVGKELLAKKVPLFDSLLANGKEVGDLHIYGCAMAMDVMGWEKEDMIDVFDDIIGVTAFLGMAQNAQLVTM
ncbi:peroxiredoxin family protein [Bacillus sp. SLBN-46]|jgi:peroxiredoxin family protein|uniref:DsrE/DsrF/DrsH-like family protein n=1 Tax=Bacillus sp. SLBN-46 TaxID=3042283 RepID=UPI00285B64AE|nr:DsrE/DsrF/DrsH-like family protein [Bacillus sp. SLBN-46]MDR6121659.1 peroxiredoxin family protein [Bacillus sp. SLBN-46]